MRIGQGVDIHRLVEGRRLVIGGVEIPHDRGLEGHSDADVLLHAITDALLGATGKGDIGVFFPPEEARWKDADSMDLLARVWAELSSEGWRVVNVDCTLLAEAPKLRPYVAEMQARISRTLGIAPADCGIKATTAEKMGFVGREEGIFASAVALLEMSADD